MIRVAPLLLALCTLLAPAAAGAQVVVLDEGTFSLLRSGERVGREDFSIRGARAQGSGFVAQGNLLAGERRRSIVLTADSAGTPLRFQQDTRQSDAVVETVLGEQQRGVWSSRILGRDRESAREFRLPSDTFVAEAGVLHHLWFVLRFGEGRPLTLLRPSGPAQTTIAIEEQAPDRVRIGARELVARRWVVRRSDDTQVLWEVWTDAQGRLLRAIDRGTGLEALRDDPPA